MHKITLKFWTLLMAALMLTGLFVASVSFGQEMPKPGEKIDKSNYKKYVRLFPEEFLPAFENGFDGMITPIHVNVVASKPLSIPKEYITYSAKNKGKYGLDANGNITGGYRREGLPFPDLQKGDKDFVTKLMWNFDSRYQFDINIDPVGVNFDKRKGEDVRWVNFVGDFLYFKNRLDVSPKPDLPNPLGLYKATLFHYTNPESVKNIITLSYRYIDPNKPDDTYLYLPSMRRVLRAEAGQRSAPLTATLTALDDLWGFDGRIPEFTYTIVKEQKVLAITENSFNPKSTTWTKKELPFPYDNYELRDTYVIDIKAKDPKYPQSLKRIWLEKENGSNIYYVVTWDRAGKVWKLWMFPFKRHAMVGGRYPVLDGGFGVDVQFGMATYYGSGMTVNKQNYNYNDVSPASLLKRAR